MAADKPPHGLPYNELWRERRFALHQVELPLRGGGVESRAVVVHPGAVVLLPLLEGDRVVLIRNHRWTVDQTLLELPAGTCEAGEKPLTTAARELAEETGYAADELTPAHGFWAAPGTSTEWMHVFVARGLRWVGQRLEADERIEPEVLSTDEVVAAIDSGEIADAKSVAVLSRWLLSRAKAP